MTGAKGAALAFEMESVFVKAVFCVFHKQDFEKFGMTYFISQSNRFENPEARIGQFNN